MIYQAIDHLNFAQGEMATFSTFIAWQLIAWGMPYWVAFVGRGRGVVRRRRRDRAGAVPAAAQRADPGQLVAFIALFSILNSADGYLWDYTIKTFPTPFGTKPLFGSVADRHA